MKNARDGVIAFRQTAESLSLYGGYDRNTATQAELNQERTGKMRKLKLLGLLLIAITGVLAVNATGAQAKWLMLYNGKSVLDLEIIGFLGLSELIIIPDVIEIHCEFAFFEKLLRLNPTHTVLTLEKWEIFFGCSPLELEEVCTVSSPGREPGEIAVEAEGEVKMNEKGETYSELSSEKFTTIAFAGEECPLSEFEQNLSGSLISTILNASEESKVHQVSLNEGELFFGEEEASLVGDLEEGGHADAVTGEAETVGGGTWALHLVEL